MGRHKVNPKGNQSPASGSSTPPPGAGDGELPASGATIPKGYGHGDGGSGEERLDVGPVAFPPGAGDGELHREVSNENSPVRLVAKAHISLSSLEATFRSGDMLPDGTNPETPDIAELIGYGAIEVLSK